MAGFNASIETMDTAATRVDEVNNEITTLLGNVRDSVSQLGGPVWRGAAQGRFTTIMAEWQQQSAKLNQALAGISETMRVNSRSFDSEDQEAASALNRVGTSGPLNI